MSGVRQAKHGAALTYGKWGGLALLLLFMRPPSPHFLFVNETIFAATARQMLMGSALYSGTMDWKGPLTYLAYGLVLKASDYSLVALHVFGIALVVLVMASAARTTWLGMARGRWLAAFFCLVVVAQTVGPAVEADLLMAALSALGYLCFMTYLISQRPSRRLLVAAGLLEVAAICCKQVAVMDLCAMLLCCLVLNRASRTLRARALDSATVLGGVALGAAALVAFVLACSSLKDYLLYSWVLPSKATQCSLGERFERWYGFATTSLTPTAILWALAAMGGLLWRRPDRGVAQSEPASLHTVSAVTGVWLLFATSGLLAFGDGLSYYLVAAAAPLAILATLGLLAIADAGQRALSRLVAVVVAACLLTLAVPVRNCTWKWRDRVLPCAAPAPPAELAGLWLRAMTEPEDFVCVVDDNSAALFWSERRSATRYVTYDLIAAQARARVAPVTRLERWGGGLPDPFAVLQSDVASHRPKYLLLAEKAKWWDAAIEADPAGREAIRRLRATHRLLGWLPPYGVYERPD